MKKIINLTYLLLLVFVITQFNSCHSKKLYPPSFPYLDIPAENVALYYKLDNNSTYQTLGFQSCTSGPLSYTVLGKFKGKRIDSVKYQIDSLSFKAYTIGHTNVVKGLEVVCVTTEYDSEYNQLIFEYRLEQSDPDPELEYVYSEKPLLVKNGVVIEFRPYSKDPLLKTPCGLIKGAKPVGGGYECNGIGIISE